VSQCRWWYLWVDTLQAHWWRQQHVMSRENIYGHVSKSKLESAAARSHCSVLLTAWLPVPDHGCCRGGLSYSPCPPLQAYCCCKHTTAAAGILLRLQEECFLWLSTPQVDPTGVQLCLQQASAVPCALTTQWGHPGRPESPARRTGTQTTCSISKACTCTSRKDDHCTLTLLTTTAFKFFVGSMCGPQCG